jgi:hypothetical protein
MFAKLVPTFADRGCHVVSATDPHGRILGFLDRILYTTLSLFEIVDPAIKSRALWQYGKAFSLRSVPLITELLPLI